MPSTSKDTHHHHHQYRIGDHITVKGFVTHHQELMGRKGIVAGPQTSSGKYPICLESTDGMEESVVLLSRKHMKRNRLNHHEHKHMEDTKEEPDVRAFTRSTPVPVSRSTAVDRKPDNIAMSAPPVAAFVPYTTSNIAVSPSAAVAAAAEKIGSFVNGEDVEQAVEQAIEHVSDELFEEESLQTDCLSWRFKDIKKKYEHDPEESFVRSTFTWAMMLQIALSIYYIIGYYRNLSITNNFYIWPTVNEYESPSFILVRSDEDRFQCEGDTFYLACHGPLYQETNYTAVEDLAKCDSEVSGGFLEFLPTVAIFLLFVATVVYFSIQRIRRRQYNQVLGLVQFKKSKSDGIVRPVKFGIAFTFLCNFAKCVPSLFESNICGRFAWGHISVDETNLLEIVKFVGVLVMAVSFMILFHLGCGYAYNLCRRGGKDCCFTRNKCLVFLLLRLILLTCFLASVVLRFADINIDISFDLEYPEWFTLSSISVIDVVVSALADVYLLADMYCIDGNGGCLYGKRNQISAVKTVKDEQQ